MAEASCGDEIISLISDFKFQNVGEGWTNHLWGSNFNDVQPLSDEILEEIMDADSLPQILKNCSLKVRRFISQGLETPFWTELAESGQLKPFIAYLYYLIDCSQKKTASSDAKRNGLLAADAYVSLCAIKGGNAYHVFNASLFQKSLDLLKLLASAHDRQPSEVSRSNRGGGGRRGRGRGRGAVRDRSSSIGSMADSNADESLNDINPDELKDLVRSFLKTLWVFVGQYSLVEHVECVESLSSSLCSLLNITSDGNDSTMRADGEYDLSTRSPAGLSFAILHKLFETDDNDKIEIISRSVFKYLLPHLLMVTSDGRHVASATIPVAMVQLRDLVKKFIEDLLICKPEGVAKAVYVILQHLCAKVTDKADYRAKVSQLIIALALDLPTETFQRFLQWMNKYSRSSKVGYRAFALDVVLSLFTKTVEKVINSAEGGQDEAKRLLDLCLRLVIGRCSDKAATVRCRALGSLTQILEDTGKRLKNLMDNNGEPDVVKQLLTEFVAGVDRNQADGMDDTMVAVPSGESLSVDVPATPEVTTPSGRTEIIRLLPLLLKRCNDDKTLARKAAVQVLECLIAVVPHCLSDEAIAVFRHRCMDVAVSVRKQALESLTALLLTRRDDILEKAWLSDVLALVVDRETAVQDKCVDVFRQTITDNLNDDGEEGERAWRLVASITMDSTTTRFAQRILQQLQKKGLIANYVIECVERASRQPNRATAAWFLLSELAEHSRFDVNGMKDTWTDGTLTGNVFNYAAKILAIKAKKMQKSTLQFFTLDLKRRVENFLLPSENIPDAMNALWQFMSTGETTGFDEWCNIMANSCVSYLSPIVFDDDENPMNEEDILRRLFMLGELFQLCASETVNQRNFYMIMAFVAADKYAEIVSRPGTDMQDRRSEVSTSQNTRLSSSQQIGTPEKNKQVNTVSVNVRSHAVIALGKLCLQDDGYAKKTVAVLVAELESAADPTIRNNIIVVLSDLCLRYTSLIDCHIGRISRRLRDPSPLVRKQTLTLLTNLLKEDYLKWRGALLFRFLTALLDADAQIRAFAEFCLVNILLQRQPTMFYLHFLECLFYFNDTRHPHWHASVDVEGEDKKEEFALAGQENRMLRLYLYRFMISHFNDEQRFNTTTRICQDILGAVSDGIVAVDKNSDEIVADSLIVLASKEMKLTSLSSSASTTASDDLGEEVDPAAAALVEATKKKISQAVKQAAIEHIIPTLMSLKIILQQNRRSGLVRLLIVYLTELTKDYKNEMKEILTNDKVLFREIEYDLKRQEKDAAPIQLPQRLL